MSIKLLSKEVASQIAAGEVVERPASVIKELLENAIDASATRISIRVEGAGIQLIEVIDDGTGIPVDELALSIERHATSKLRTAGDLFSINTLGFRGEALASIASVSHLTLQSTTSGSEIGAQIRVDGGISGQLEPMASTQGTTIRVEDLFYNVPARLSFLKKAITEKQANENYINRYATAYPSIQFHFSQDGKTVFRTSGNGMIREAYGDVYGMDQARSMLELDFSEKGLKIGGLISPISVSRSNRREITFFVNGRWIQDLALTTALLQAYHTYLMVGRYPVVFLSINLPPEEVDVNIHPTKSEVRFREPDKLFSGVQRAVKKALLAYSPLPSINQLRSWTQPERINHLQEAPKLLESTIIESTIGTSNAKVLPQSTQTLLPILRLIGQIGAVYLVAEGPDGLYLIDQHAAHERILYEKMISHRIAGEQAQRLLEPVLVHMSPSQANQFSEYMKILNLYGFQIEHFGGNDYLLRSIPVLFQQSDPQELLSSLTGDIEEDERLLEKTLEDRIVARICKRAAVKGGNVLALEEQQRLLDDLQACQSPRTCPHGRPTMIHLSVDLLERQFGRRGAR